MVKTLLGTLAIVLFSGVASAQMQAISSESMEGIKEALQLALNNSSLTCENNQEHSEIVRSIRNTIRTAGSGEINMAGDQPLVILIAMNASQTRMGKLIVTSSPDQTQITGIRYEIYSKGRVNSGTITNPVINDAWVPYETNACN